MASPDLKEWNKLDEVRIAHSSECPDFFPMPIENELGSTKWIFWSANNTYLIGDFDGRKFVDKSGPLRDIVGTNYAAQTFSDIPAADGRRVQIAWMRDGRYPGMPFNQQMSFPSVLALRRFQRVCDWPTRQSRSSLCFMTGNMPGAANSIRRRTPWPTLRSTRVNSARPSIRQTLSRKRSCAGLTRP